MASVSFTFAALAPGPYRSLREPGARRALDHTPANPPRHQPLDPAPLGRTIPDNVVIATPEADTPHVWPVIVRTDHPGYFDHPLDHVSAAVMVEACRQAAGPTPAAACDLVSVRARFTAFAEHGPSLYARVHDGPTRGCDDTSLAASPVQTQDTATTVSLVQMQGTLATVDMTLRAIENQDQP